MSRSHRASIDVLGYHRVSFSVDAAALSQVSTSPILQVSVVSKDQRRWRAFVRLSKEEPMQLFMGSDADQKLSSESSLGMLVFPRKIYNLI